MHRKYRRKINKGAPSLQAKLCARAHQAKGKQGAGKTYKKKILNKLIQRSLK